MKNGTKGRRLGNSNTVRASGHPARIVEDPELVERRAHPAPTTARGKHGFYASIFKPAERRLLEQVPPTDLAAEIELIRVANKRFLHALAASKDDLDFETQLTALRAVNLSAHSIATLLRAHALAEALLGDLEDLPADANMEQL